MTKRDYRAEWDPRQRYRPYKISKDGEQTWVACAGAETAAGMGTMIVTLKEDGEWEDHEAVGVLDTLRWAAGKPGEWIINPYAGVRK